jgi:hypothetical protein
MERAVRFPFASAHGTRVVADVGFILCFFVAAYLFVTSSSRSPGCPQARMRFVGTTWLAVSFTDISAGNSLQGFVFDSNGTLHTVTRLGVDGAALRLPAGYSHVGAGAFAGATTFTVPLEKDTRRDSLVALFVGNNLTSTCELAQQQHAPWVSLYSNDTLLLSSDFDSVTRVCSYAMPPVCEARGCSALPGAFSGVQGGAVSGGTLFLASEAGPCGRGITLLEFPSLEVLGFVPVCVGFWCMGEIEGVSVFGSRVVLAGNYGAWRVRMEWALA